MATFTGTSGNGTLAVGAKADNIDGLVANDSLRGRKGEKGVESAGVLGAMPGLLDVGQSLTDVCTLAASAGIAASLAGGAGIDRLAGLPVNNVLGTAGAATLEMS